MTFFFANPWGLLAVAAIPAIVVIHFLQERSRRVRTSTLFLLEHAQPTSEGGLRIERFRQSVPFWMQILAACALAWLLADPRWVRAEPRQTVVVVLDSSASMRAFREPTLAALSSRLNRWDAAADRTDWHLLETGPRRPPLYAGRSRSELVKAATDRWQPTLGTHSSADALAVARALVPGDAGVVILVTDQPAAAPLDVAVLSVGEPFDNVGFSGGDVVSGEVESGGGGLSWRVLVTNHGDVPQRRTFTLRAAGDAGLATGEPLAPPQPIELAPRQSRSFTGPWPADGRGRIVLALSADHFDLDDTMPLVKPALRRVAVSNRLAGPAGELLGRMIAAADGVDLVPPSDDPATAGRPDLVIDRLGGEAATSGVFVTMEDPATDAAAADQASAATKQSFDPAVVAAEDHPLVRGLGWGGLLSGPAGNVAVTRADAPLLWKGPRPLAFLRETSLPGGRRTESLVLNWDLAGSSASRTAAMVVLLARFVDRVRERIPRGWADNFETGQAILLPDGLQARAPQTPQFFRVPFPDAGQDPARAGQAQVIQAQAVQGAAHFADARECDFRPASAADTLDDVRMERVVKRSVEDPWAPLWVAVAAAALLVAWAEKGARHQQ